ncbi:MAG: DUF1499 domain-containing protein [Gemmatimonadaceae bacterium]
MFTSPLISRLLLALTLFAPIDAMAQRQLPRCPDTPNCVSTDAERESQRMVAVPFTDTPASALARAKAAVLAESRSKIVAADPTWLKAECKSFLFRFVDDVEVIVDTDSHTFRFRSASRVGRGDMGVNRKRMERISARLRE